MFEELEPDFAAWLSGLRPPAPGDNTRAAREVPDSAEFRRIRDAEWCDWEADPRLPQLIEMLSAHLRAPGGQQTFKKIQAGILQALYNHKRVVGPIRTAGGKTLTTFSAPEVVGAKRPLLLVPAKMIKSGKTLREHRAARPHWQLRPLMSAAMSKAQLPVTDFNRVYPLRVVSFEAMANIKYANALDIWQPDLLMGDEIHKVKDPDSAAARRISRYVRGRTPPEWMLFVTGSFINRSLTEIAHILRWLWGDDSPIPCTWNEVQLWRFAMDEKINEATRIEPGALANIAPAVPEDAEFSERVQAVRRFGRRFRSWPGVIASGSDVPEVLLTCRTEQLVPDAATEDAVEYTRERWETPSGQPFEMPTQLWEIERQLSAGFYNQWTVEPPFEWLWARKAWSAFVREARRNHRTLDTELQVVNAIDAGRIADPTGTLATWRAVRDTFDPDAHREPVWISDVMLQHCANWLHSKDGGGIVWVHHIPFGERLSQMSKVPYFSSGGMCANIPIDQHHGPTIASVSAIGEGFNLHTIHHRNMIAQTPTTCRANEQMISRTHRDEQPQDEVEVIYLQMLEGDRRALDQACADALHVESVLGQPQRLRLATWLTENETENEKLQ